MFGEAVERTKISLIRESEREREQKRNFLDIERIGWLIGGVFSPTGCGLRIVCFFSIVDWLFFFPPSISTPNPNGKGKWGFLDGICTSCFVFFALCFTPARGFPRRLSNCSHLISLGRTLSLTRLRNDASTHAKFCIGMGYGNTCKDDDGRLRYGKRTI